MSVELARARLRHVAPVLRGALAEPTGDADRPHRRVVVVPLVTPEVLAFVDREENRALALTPPLTSDHLIRTKAFPLWIERPAYDEPARLATQLREAVAGYVATYGAYLERHAARLPHGLGRFDALPRVVLLPGLGALCTGGDVRAAIVARVPLDVTDASSVADAFASVAATWGGVDIVVVNAGLAHVAGLPDLEIEAFRRLERVNVEGALLVMAEAARHLKLQGTGGDIVLVSTKNVFAPGAKFGAYSATKAAAHQLARIASLELADIDVRVNMVAPDAVFSHGARRSGLWATVGPDRMRARGLDEAGLEDYYRGRNLLKARVTADHVGRAVLFFATRQTPTTGATIPVDGGLPDATPR